MLITETMNCSKNGVHTHTTFASCYVCCDAALDDDVDDDEDDDNLDDDDDDGDDNDLGDNRVYAQTRFCAFDLRFRTVVRGKRRFDLRSQTTNLLETANMICSTCVPCSFAIINV